MAGSHKQEHKLNPHNSTSEVEPMIEWKTAQKAANMLERMLTDETPYTNLHGYKVQNMYVPVAWIRLSRTISTLSVGMMCLWLTFEGKSNREIEEATGICSSSIATYKAWNTTYAFYVGKMRAEKGKTAEQRSRAIQSLFSMGVTF